MGCSTRAAALTDSCKLKAPTEEHPAAGDDMERTLHPDEKAFAEENPVVGDDMERTLQPDEQGILNSSLGTIGPTANTGAASASLGQPPTDTRTDIRADEV